jgi:predicted metal-dependent hydrolase
MARPLKLDIPADTPRHWMGDDPFETHLLNALSLTFPAGERFFMASVRALRDRVKDPLLQEQVRGFLAQEAYHSREHGSLNEWLERLGFPARAVEKRIADGMATRSAQRERLDDLAVTCALEHFTAIMAETWLNDDELRARCHQNVRALWTWHALEELDHKAVAFDVYQAAGGEYERRATIMAFVTIGLVATVARIQFALMKRDGQHRNIRSWASGLYRTWGPGGYFLRMVPAYLAYYRRNFHPWQRDDRELIERGERELAELVPATVTA